MRLDEARVLVTGGTGFLGRHVCDALRNAGAVAVPVGSAHADLRDEPQVAGLLDRTRPDAVVHLAAVVGGIGANQREPGRFFHDNMLMGVHLLEACRQQRVEKVVLVGTACSYPGDAPVPTTEDQLWHGFPEPTNAPYGLAKRALVVQGQAYRAQYGCNIVSVIPTNLYGPGDNLDLDSGHVIPNLVRRFSEAHAAGAAEVTLWGDGTPTRDFLYVGDAAAGCVAALRRYDGEEPVNLATGHETSIAELAELVRRRIGFGGSITWDAARPNGQERRCLDSSRAQGALGWRPEVALEEGLDRTVRWFRSLSAHVPAVAR